MEGTTRLLMYGSDTSLLETRREVLHTAGFSVDVVQSPAEFAQHVQSRPGYRGAILCHTTPGAVRPILRHTASEHGLPIHQITGMLLPRQLIEELRRTLAA